MALPDAGGTRRRPADGPARIGLHGIVWHARVSDEVAPALDTRREGAAREVLAALAAGEGLVALTGPAHVGKTAVLDMVAGRLEGAGVRVLRVEGAAAADGKLSLRALLAQVAGRDIEGMEEGAVEELLDLLDGTGAGVVVVVDDAQTLQPDAAEFFRLLAMLGRGQKRRSRVVFAGRPAFWDVFPDDPKGRARLVGARIALEADEKVPEPQRPVAAPTPAAEPARPAARWRVGLVAMGIGGVVLAGAALAGIALHRSRPVAEMAVAVAPVPVEAPVPGRTAVPVLAEGRVETPPVGGVARRDFAEGRVETPPVGGVARRDLAEGRVEAPPVGGVARRDFAEGRVEAPPAGGVAGRNERAAPVGSAAAVDPALVAGLMRRGAALVEVGDISAARLAFGRAVAAGEAAAATALGRTFDPGFLAQIGGRGIEGDAAEAERWYRRGAEMGDAAAAMALRGLGGN